MTETIDENTESLNTLWKFASSRYFVSNAGESSRQKSATNYRGLHRPAIAPIQSRNLQIMSSLIKSKELEGGYIDHVIRDMQNPMKVKQNFGKRIWIYNYIHIYFDMTLSKRIKNISNTTDILFISNEHYT